VNLGLAKDQHLSLNPSQISGGCGRLLCCLKYEHEFYVAARKRFPKEGKSLRTAVGVEKVVAVDIFRERVFLKSEEHGSRIIPLVQLREEVERLGEVLPTPESRPKPLALPETAELAPTPSGNGNGGGNGATRPDDAPRRRRRRRGGGGRAAPGTPSGPES
jgi:hypothetical protein